jgi:hypothetical protein
MGLHMVEIFRTNIRRKRQAKAVIDILSRRFPLFRINFDLEDCDNILRVEGEDICATSIAVLLMESGYECDALE